MYTWTNSVTHEQYATRDLRKLVYIIRQTYRIFKYEMPRGIRIMKDGLIYWALWYENGAVYDIAYHLSPTMQRQSALHQRAVTFYLINYDLIPR